MSYLLETEKKYYTSCKSSALFPFSLIDDRACSHWRPYDISNENYLYDCCRNYIHYLPHCYTDHTAMSSKCPNAIKMGINYRSSERLFYVWETVMIKKPKGLIQTTLKLLINCLHRLWSKPTNSYLWILLSYQIKEDITTIYT